MISLNQEKHLPQEEAEETKKSLCTEDEIYESDAEDESEDFARDEKALVNVKSKYKLADKTI